MDTYLYNTHAVREREKWMEMACGVLSEVTQQMTLPDARKMIWRNILK